MIEFLKTLFTKAKLLFGEGEEILEKVENIKTTVTEKKEEEVTKPKVSRKKTTPTKQKQPRRKSNEG